MPRFKRLTCPGAFHHIYNRGLNKKIIFPTNQDYEKFLNKLDKLNQELDFSLYSYVLLPNHFHLLIEIAKTPLASIMKKLLTSYSVYFNLKYQQHGPLFEDRYKSKLIQKESYFLELSRYIHLNPVKAGLASDPAKYPHSSFGEVIGSSPSRFINKENVQKLIGKSNYSLNSYSQFVYAGINKDLSQFNPWRERKEIIGSRRFTTNRFKKYS